MKVKLWLVFLLMVSLNSFAQVKVVDYETLAKEFKVKGDSIAVVNFWSTTCKPCIEEFPYFLMAQEEYKDQLVKFIYVSLDFSKQKARVEDFIQKKGLKGKFYLLKDDPNVWINKVNKGWGGDIPYTLLVKRNGDFMGHDVKFISFEELNKFIKNNQN